MVGRIVRTALAAAAALIVSHATAQAQTCGVVLDKTALPVGANEANWSINVTADAACAWSATSDSDWLVVKSTMPAAAAGNGYAKVRAITNTTSAARRTGHFFVNGVVYTVTQSGCGANCAPVAQAAEPVCSIALDKTALTVGQTEANWSINVTAPAACAWTATSDSDWLIVRSTTPAVPAGNGSARIRAVTNLTTPAKRVGHVTVNGLTYTVTQGGCGTNCTGSTPQPQPQPLADKVRVPGTPLRVLQYNSHHGGWGSDGVYSPDRIVAQIMKANPDVVTMNEIEQGTSWSKGLDQVKIYESLLEKATGYNWYAVFMNHAGATTGNGNLILSTFPFIATASYLLPVSRSAVDATIDVDGRMIDIVSTHLDAENSSYRINEIKALLTWAAPLQNDRIVIGDYNASPESTEIRNMTVDYVDTWKAAVAVGTATGDGYTHGTHRIDYIFLSKKASFLKLASMVTFKSKDAAGVTPSDHEPVLAVFNVQ